MIVAIVLVIVVVLVLEKRGGPFLQRVCPTAWRGAAFDRCRPTHVFAQKIVAVYSMSLTGGSRELSRTRTHPAATIFNAERSATFAGAAAYYTLNRATRWVSKTHARITTGVKRLPSRL